MRLWTSALTERTPRQDPSAARESQVTKDSKLASKTLRAAVFSIPHRQPVKQQRWALWESDFLSHKSLIIKGNGWGRNRTADTKIATHCLVRIKKLQKMTAIYGWVSHIYSGLLVHDPLFRYLDGGAWFSVDVLATRLAK
jgi:hypothetical protein